MITHIIESIKIVEKGYKSRHDYMGKVIHLLV